LVWVSSYINEPFVLQITIWRKLESFESSFSIQLNQVE
jgi:hypothetical protein